MNPRIPRHFLIAAAMAFALPAASTRACADESCAKPGGPGMMPPPPGVEGGPGMMPPPPGMDAGPGGTRNGSPPEFGPRAGGLPSHLHGLDLSDAQAARIAGIYRSLFEQMREKGAEAAQARDALRDLALTDAYDEAKAKTLADAAAGAMADIASAHARADHAVFLLLTPEQRTRLKERANRPMPGFRPPPREQRGR